MISGTRPARRIRPFTPAYESPALLSQRTVGRGELLMTIVDRLAAAATTRNRPHTLLVGPRGSGKSHLLSVAVHRALQRPEVAKRLLFVRFDEDAVGITRYFDILQEVLLKLAPSPMGRRVPLPANPEEAISVALGDRVLVLVIENLDRIFDALGEGGQQDLRSWVENSGQIMVLASTPTLFPGVSDRSLPWWGNFGISHLEELDLDQGRELLIKLATESGDLELADFLATKKGEARLQALNALAGGSPRIWVILSECLTVDLLDELVPAVEALLDGLVSYYQQLLWDLSPVEQRLIRVLADGPHQAATVSELAEAAAVDRRVAATTLGRLADISWVRPEKAPQLDQRSTWYRLREPMLRHHFHYRSASDQPLPLIVDILRAWYDPTERRDQLAQVEPASQAERFLAAALGSEPPSGDESYNSHDVDRLVAEARRWAQGFESASRTRDAGVVIDLVVCAVRQGPSALRRLAARRGLEPENRSVIRALFEQCEVIDHLDPVDKMVATLLRSATEATKGRTRLVLELVSACWDGHRAPESARDRLAALVPLTDLADPLGINVRSELASWSGRAGDVVQARDQFAELIPVCVRVLGAEHRDTLAARSNLARWSGDAGEVVWARDQFAELVPVWQRVLRAEHRDTLVARLSLAYWSGEAGDPALARDQFAELVPVCARVLGGEHRDTLAARWNLARWSGEAGDSVGARDQFAQLIPMWEREWGAGHRATLAARSDFAFWMGEAGDPAAACELAGQLLARYVGRTDLRPGLRAATADILIRNLGRVPTVSIAKADKPVGISDLGLVGLLQAAVGGSAEALVRLPSELVPIVESLRAERA